jgi:hypothetical protein
VIEMAASNAIDKTYREKMATASDEILAVIVEGLNEIIGG